MIKEWRYQDGDIAFFWLHFLSQEEQLTTIQDTEWILEHGAEAEAPLSCTSETKTDYNRSVRGKVICRAHCPPQGQYNTGLRGLPWPSDSAVGKENHAGKIQHLQHCGSLCGNPFIILPHEDFRGILEVQSRGILLWQWNGKDIAITSTGNLADQVHTCSSQVVIPTNVFAHL